MNFVCPDCGKETDRLEGIGMEDYLNNRHRCSDCNDKKYPERIKIREKLKEREAYNALADALMRSVKKS